MVKYSEAFGSSGICVLNRGMSAFKGCLHLRGLD